MTTSIFTLAAVLVFCAVAPCVTATPVSRGQVYAHLSHYEGVRYVPYHDGGAHWAVGVGHQLRGIHRKPLYTHREVNAFFTSDLDRARQACRTRIVRFDSLPADAQLIALSVAFGTGPTGYSRFHQFNGALSRRDYGAAARALEHSHWWIEVGPDRSQDAVRCLRRLR